MYAMCLHGGSGLAQNLMMAEAWYLMAAQNGNEEAQYMAGTFLFLTRTERCKWLLLAAESSFDATAKMAKDELALLKPTLSDSQIKDAEDSAMLWKRLRRLSSEVRGPLFSDGKR